jgi:RNA polymerase sigma factor (sigma-70 family)
LSDSRKYSPEEIIEGILANNTLILNQFYKENFLLIRHLIITNSGSEDDAKDVFQEAMVVLYRKLKTENIVITSSLSTYLYSVARLVWLKELHRKSKNRVDFSDTLDEFMQHDRELPDIIERNERLKLYRENFEQLSEDCKTILHMFLNNIPVREITLSMGYSKDQHTKNRRYRCKKTLINKIRKSDKFKELGNEKDIED